MKSITDVLKENILISTEPNVVQMMIDNGKSFDSLFEKWHTYNNKYEIINESYREFYNVSLTSDEQIAAKALLASICESYIASLEAELSEESLNEGLKDKLKEIRDKAAEKIQKIKTKISELNQFLKDIANKTIQSIKELVKRITDMMIKLGENLAKLVQKLGGDEKSSLKTLEDEVNNALKDEKTSKENVYENFALELQNSINEGLFDRFRKNKKENAEENEEERDEYDDALAQKKSKGNGRNIWGVIGNIVLQMFAYYGVTIILPAIITLIGGPVAGSIAAAIAKILWSSFTIYKQVKREFQIRKKPDGEYHSYPKWRKIAHNMLFAVSIIGSTAAGIAGIKDGVKIIDALKSHSEGLIKQILPPENVQNLLKFVDKHIKNLDGIKGYDELVKAQEAIDKGFVELQEEIPEQTEVIAAKEMGPEEVKKMQDVVNQTMKGVKASEWNQEMINRFDDLKGSLEQGYTYATANVDYKGGIQAVLKTTEGQEFLSKYGDLFKYSPVQSSNVAGTTYSCILQFKEGLPQTKEAVEAFSKLLHNAGNGSATILGTIANATRTIPGVAAKSADVIGVVGTSVPFGGLLPIAMKGPNFRVRLGSNRTGNSGIYEVQDKKEMTFKECKKKYGDKNSKVFAQMEKQINKNYKELQAWKTELEKDESANKKELKNIDKALEKMEEAVEEEYKLLVFFGIPVEKQKKETDENQNESRYCSLRNYIFEAEEPEEETIENNEDNTEENDESKKPSNKKEKQPIFFINPMLMGCGDLANRSKSKGPRSNLYYFKGLLSSIEVLPIPGGASQKEIIDMFIKLMTESIKANLNMVPDKPCTKDGRKYIVNQNSKKSGNRKDFGDFTNEEITEIINNKNEAGKYLSGKYKTKHSTIEKNDTTENEEHNKKVKAEFKKYIEENDKIKEFLSKHKKLRQFLTDDEGNVKDDSLDEISDLISRSESAYLQGKRKKGFFAKIKSWFKEEEDNDELSEIDPDDISTLSLMIHQLRKKDGRMKKESLIHPLYTDNIIDEDLNADLFFEANMQTLVEEFSEWLTNENMFDTEEQLIEE